MMMMIYSKLSLYDVDSAMTSRQKDMLGCAVVENRGETDLAKKARAWALNLTSSK